MFVSPQHYRTEMYEPALSQQVSEFTNKPQQDLTYVCDVILIASLLQAAVMLVEWER